MSIYIIWMMYTTFTQIVILRVGCETVRIGNINSILISNIRDVMNRCNKHKVNMSSLSLSCKWAKASLPMNVECWLLLLWIIVFQRPITTICWGHRDSRLFLACGPALYVVRVEHRVASLQLLCQQGIASALREEKDVGKLNMPSLLCSYVTTAFIPTIKVHWSLINCCAETVIGSFLPTLLHCDNAKLLTVTCFHLSVQQSYSPFLSLF